MKKFRLSLENKRTITGIVFISPWLIGFLAFFVRSVFMTVQFSLNTLTMDTVNGGYTLDFVGLKNFVYAFNVHGTFKQVLTSSVIDMVIDVPLIIFFSLLMALMLNAKFPGRTLVRAIFFLPVILNADAILSAISTAQAMIAGGVSSSSQELAEQSSGMGIAYYIDLFGSMMIPETVLEYIVGAVGRITNIISASGVQIVIFIAALQAIPSSLYEVADMEGATAYETFWKITFPMVTPHIITNVVYTVVDSFTNSEVVNLAYSTAFTDFNYGLSSVFSLVSTVVTCAILVAVCGLISKKAFYYN